MSIENWRIYLDAALDDCKDPYEVSMDDRDRMARSLAYSAEMDHEYSYHPENPETSEISRLKKEIQELRDNQRTRENQWESAVKRALNVHTSDHVSLEYGRLEITDGFR